VKHCMALALAGALVLSGCYDGSESTDTNPLAPSLDAAAVQVTTVADAGAGSLRAALAAAEQDSSITRIQFSSGLGTIALVAPLSYAGPQALKLQGAGATLDASGLTAGTLTALLVDGAAGFAIQDLSIVNSPGTALTVKVPATATGTFAVELTRFTAKNAQLHGVLINDQAHYFEDPETESQDGSDAALQVRVTASLFEGNGFGAADQDGLRVNEGGAGNLDFVALGTVFTGNGADGLELDERGAGDAVFTVQQSTLLNNGAKVNDPIDFDDGMDVDEFADGSLIGRVIQTTANDNFEEGFDLNENDAGDLRIDMDQVQASGNAEEGVDLEEDDDFIGGGDLIADLRNVTTLRNGSSDGDAGLKLRERGDGSILSRIVQATASDNLIDGIQIREQDGGSVDAQIVNSTASGNDGNGVRVRGEGVAKLQSVTAEGNGADDFTADAGITMTQVGTTVP
jgi:hypothetical protein